MERIYAEEDALALGDGQGDGFQAVLRVVWVGKGYALEGNHPFTTFQKVLRRGKLWKMPGRSGLPDRPGNLGFLGPG